MTGDLSAFSNMQENDLVIRCTSPPARQKHQDASCDANSASLRRSKNKMPNFCHSCCVDIMCAAVN